MKSVLFAPLRQRYAAVAKIAAIAAIAAASCGTAAAPPANAPATPPANTSATQPAKVLRYAFRIAETGFDPVQVNDLYSRSVVANIFDAPYAYDYLARPVKIRLNTAAAMPDISPDFRAITVRIKPGIYFQDDPAFKGKKRELTAHDYVYSYKRHYDPRWKSPSLYLFENAKLPGLSELRQKAISEKKPFDYDTEVDGMRALDRYTFQIRLGEPLPRWYMNLADPAYMGAVAREVVEAYGDRIMEKPVGTGPFRLKEWRRSSLTVLERNPDFRDERYELEAAPDDPEAVAFTAKLSGRKLPMIDRIEISIIEENQPRWLAFLNAEHDFLDEVPADFANLVIPNNELAPNLKRRGIRMDRYARADVALSYFGMEHPVVGGYTPEKVALRRAISLAVNLEEEIRVVRRSQAIPAQSPVGPQVYGYDPSFKSEMGEFSRAKARALLDLYGWVDRDGDGWREQPDGEPLVLEYATQPDDQSRQLITQWKKNMDAIGIRIQFRFAKWPENLKNSRAGRLMMWGVGWSATAPDGDTFLALGYSRNKGQANHARFELPEFDRVYEKQRVLPNGPEREKLFVEAKKLMIAYMPYKVHAHRYFTDLTHPWVIGARRNVFVRDWWKYVDIDTGRLAQEKK